LESTDTQLISLTKTNPELNSKTSRIYVSKCSHVTFAAAAVCSGVAPDTDGVYITVNGDAFTIGSSDSVGALDNDGAFVGLLVVDIVVGSEVLVGVLVFVGALDSAGAFVGFLVVAIVVGSVVGAIVVAGVFVGAIDNDGAFVGTWVVASVVGSPVAVGSPVGALVLAGIFVSVFVGALDSDAAFVGLWVESIAVGSVVGALVVSGVIVDVLGIVGASVDSVFVGVVVVESVDGLPVCRNVGVTVRVIVGGLVFTGALVVTEGIVSVVLDTAVGFLVVTVVVVLVGKLVLMVAGISVGREEVGLNVGTSEIPFDGGIVIFVGIIDSVGKLVMVGINVNDDKVVGDIVGLLVGLLVGMLVCSLIGLDVRIRILIRILLRDDFFLLIIPFPLGEFMLLTVDEDIPFPVPGPVVAFVILNDIIPFPFVDIANEVISDGDKFVVIDITFIPILVFDSKPCKILGDKLLLVGVAIA
jgi:hypothetical protein